VYAVADRLRASQDEARAQRFSTESIHYKMWVNNNVYPPAVLPISYADFVEQRALPGATWRTVDAAVKQQISDFLPDTFPARFEGSYRFALPGEDKIVSVYRTDRGHLAIDGLGVASNLTTWLVTATEARKEIARAIATMWGNRYSAEARAKEQQEMARYEAEMNDTDGFAERLDPRFAARVRKTLQANMLVAAPEDRTEGHKADKVLMARRDFVRRAVRAGWTVREYGKFGRVLFSPATPGRSESFYDVQDLTKTGLDYAAYLIALSRGLE